MVDLYRELRRIVGALDQARVDYALAGGLAVSIYTVPRATEDIDLVIATGDLGRAVTALRPLGFQAAGRPMVVASGRLEIQRLIRIEGPDLLALDLLTTSDPSLAHLLADRRAIEWEGRQVWIVGIESLRELDSLSSEPASTAQRGLAATLRAVSALRALCLRLPHLATPAEEERLRQFERLVAAPESASDVDVEALAAGWRRWWREGRIDRIAEMAERLPPDLVEDDRRLASFAVAARQVKEAGRR